MLAGCGTYQDPYNFNFSNDPLAKSLVYFHRESLKTKLPSYFENMNSLLSKLSFYKLTRQAMKDLSDVIEWIEVGNKNLFNPVDIKMTLYIFENSYQEVEGGAFKQRRRSLPLESLVFETFPDLYKGLIRFIQSKLLVKKSEIRFGLVFRPFNLDKKRKLQDRVRRMIQNYRSNNDQFGVDFTNSSTSLLFVSDDEDEDTQQDYADFKKQSAMPVLSQEPEVRSANLGNLMRSSEEKPEDDNTEALMSESNMQESTVHVHGAPAQTHQVKIIDKSKRAYSFSVDSTKAFELSLQKPRDECKHKFTRFRAVLYAIWILFFKHIGKPPGSSGLYTIFLMFSALLSIDLIILVALIMHIFSPITNLNTIGIAFLLIYPFTSVLAPLSGALACLSGDARFLKFHSACNAACVLVTYPVTLAVQIYFRDEVPYIAMV